MNIIIQCEICKTIWIMQCNEMHHTTGGRDHCLQSAMLFNALMQWNVLWIVHMSNDMCRSNNTYIVFSHIRGLKRDRCLLTRELQCNAMEWAIHPLWIVQFNETFITSALKCAMQYNRQSNDQKFIAPWVVTSATMFPSEDKIAWHHHLIFKALDQRIQKFQLGIEYFGKLFWTVEFIGMKTGGRGWIFLVSLKPPPKSNLEPCTVWGGGRIHILVT